MQIFTSLGKKRNRPSGHLQKYSPLLFYNIQVLWPWILFFFFLVMLSNSPLQKPHATPCKVWPKDFCKFNQHLSGTAPRCMNVMFLRQAVLCSRQQPTEAQLCGAWSQCFVACERFSPAVLKAQIYCVAAVCLPFCCFFNIRLLGPGKVGFGVGVGGPENAILWKAELGGRDAEKKCGVCTVWPKSLRQSAGFFCIDSLAWYSVELSIRTARTGHYKHMEINVMIAY